MAKANSFLRITSFETFEKFLLSLQQQENSQREFLFSTVMIDSLCKEKSYSGYRFAHDLEGNIYMRIRFWKITLEYLVILSNEGQDYNAYVYQVFQSGQRIYSRPRVPAELIHIQWSNAN